MSALSLISLLLFGARCAGCGARGSATPCPRCIDQIQATPGAPGAGFADAGPIGRLIRTGKRGDWRIGGSFFAQLLLSRVEVDSTWDVVTWVPADRRRRARRGGHFPERIARAMAKQLQLPARDLLRRSARSQAQRGLGRRARLGNVASSFVADPALMLDGQHILLIDDVRTTGATLRACVLALRARGAVITPLAVTGVAREAGIDRTGVGKSMPSAEFALTKRPSSADGFRHDRRKAAPAVRTPRPP